LTIRNSELSRDRATRGPSPDSSHAHCVSTAALTRAGG
jgi:hypothetical protein